jgi:peptidoglycan/xylan/chitin deacetylase (PgdA/CDA1 family)
MMEIRGDENLPISSSIPVSPSVLAYHQIDKGVELGVNSIPPDVFERQIRLIVSQGYTTITPDGLINALSSHFSAGSLPRQPILLTFDDGYESFYTYAYPILKKYGLTATVFIPAGYIGQPNTWDVKLRLNRPRHLTRDQIRTLSKNGIRIGSHGMYHRFLTRCSQAEAREELEESRTMLENILQQPVYSFAYPYGSANAAAEKMAQSAGYRIAFGLDPGREATRVAVFRFPRIAVYRCDTMQAFQAKLGLLGRSRFSMECMKNRLINRFAYLNLLRQMQNKGNARQEECANEKASSS